MAPRFGDYLSSLGQGDEGGTMYPDNFLADIQAAYDDDIAEINNTASAAVAVAEGQLTGLRAENTSLAAANWNLTQSIPRTNPDGKETPDNSDGEDGGSETDPANWFE